jgi:phenylalanyl-tRNA synthetase alpha chain
MKDELRKIRDEALAEASSSQDAAAVEKIRVKYLGRKGILTGMFKKMAGLPAEEKPGIGSLINTVKADLLKALDGKAASFSSGEDYKKEKLDITLPGVAARPGRRHPITKCLDEICDIFISLGFMVVEGPEIETEYYNFEALNIPLEHPSRDAFDTFYLESIVHSPQPIDKEYLLRSHTSPVQVRFMERNKPPFSIVVPGKVYRPDATDASHSFMFHQVEGLVVGENVRFSDLKGALGVFARQMFGESAKTRFRPSFFPFTEPSAEVDVSCIICGN